MALATIAVHALLLLLGTGAFFLGIFSIFHHSRMFREFYHRLNEKHNYYPSVSVLAPVRGVDKYLEENVMSLLAQDYPKSKWEVLLIVDKSDDETKKKIRQILSRSKTRNAKIVQSVPLFTCSGKSAAMIIGAKKARFSAIAGWDSDARVAKNWLASLVGPLEDEKIGATTGYRFYSPSHKFSSYVLSLWNMLGFISMKEPHAFVWGGSFAIKKKTLEKLGIVRGWATAISDDVVVSQKVWSAGLKVHFAPSCIVRSHLNTKGIGEFAARQVTIVRWERPSAYKFMFALFAFTRISTVLGLVTLCLYFTTGNPLFALESFLLLWFLVWSALRASMDFRNFQVLLNEQEGSRLTWIIADFFAQWLAFYSFAAALRKNTITWQGRTYDFRKKATGI